MLGYMDGPYYIVGDIRNIDKRIAVVSTDPDADALYDIGVDIFPGIIVVPGSDNDFWGRDLLERLAGYQIFIFPANDNNITDYNNRCADLLTAGADSVYLLDLTTVWPALPEYGGIAQLIKHFGTDVAADKLCKLMSETKPYSLWKEPQPIDNTSNMLDALPPFPVHCLPPAMSGYASALASNIQVPIEMVGLMCLGILSSVYQRRYKANPRKGWTEVLVY